MHDRRTNHYSFASTPPPKIEYVYCIISRLSSRTGLLALLTGLVVALATDGASAAGTLFENDYINCPARTRLSELSDLTVARTDQADELRVTWLPPESTVWESLPNRGFSAGITVIVDRAGAEPHSQTLPLGAHSVLFDGIEVARDWKVQAAVTDMGHVINNIAATTFTSGLPQPAFHAPIYFNRDRRKLLTDEEKQTGTQVFVPTGDNAFVGYGETVGVAKTYPTRPGLFFYLGFGEVFDNWHFKRTGSLHVTDIAEARASCASAAPYFAYNPWFGDVYIDECHTENPKFRIGLRHGLTSQEAEDAGFDHFRIRMTNAQGEDVLGYDAGTVEEPLYIGSAPRLFPYGSLDGPEREVWRQEINPLPWGQHIETINANNVYANVRVASKAEGGPLPALYTVNTFDEDDSSTWDIDDPSNPVISNRQLRHVFNGLEEGDKVTDDLSFHWLQGPWKRSDGQLFVPTPDQILDLPPNVLDPEASYTLTAWAENEDNERISPEATLTFEPQVRLRGAGYYVVSPASCFDAACDYVDARLPLVPVPDTEGELTVLRLTILAYD